jgi:16S rRNA (cytidine1402-2'-O)-methyltransferase|tara:strand:- start:1072 stop:1758 length:687 start_codon:yes stop_codon:yes gene_type:complete
MLDNTVLFLVPTPIGNLADMTFRAIDVLKSVDLILAEDTRTSGILLKHYEIHTPMKSFHTHNEHQQTEIVIKKLEEGIKVALISDAGSPGISDPGYLLAKAALDAQLQIEALPGPTALIPAIIKSGFPNNRFVFEGFLPQKKGRSSRINSLKNEERTLIFYESPHRILKTLMQFEAAYGEDRKVSVSRELSKKFEQTINGSLSSVRAHFENHKPKGEFVIVLSGNSLK